LSSTRRLVLRRMLMPRVRGVNSYETDTIVLTGILATRVQMGHVSRKVASTLVADGYAHLVGFVPRSIGLELDIDSKSKITTHEDIAHICYLPDPVCAHLAMCLMDADWKSSDNVKGQSPKFWSNVARELFTSGICYPDKGNVGEVGVSLYLLYCSDDLRKEMNIKPTTTTVTDKGQVSKINT
jgi:hypothetical protein